MAEHDENLKEEENQEVSPLDMSEEDFLKLEFPDETTNSDDGGDSNDSGPSGEAGKEGGDGDGDDGQTGDEDDKGEGDGDDDKSGDHENTDADDEGDKGSANADPLGDFPGDGEKNSQGKQKQNDSSQDGDKDKGDSSKEGDGETGSVDYEAQYNKVFAPFKANGKEMQVDNIDDARRLMQMGANYNKKMQGLKPALKVIKMLENNDLLDENKLSYLIDLDKKNPEAIKKLIKESGLDPLDIDVKEDSDYAPTDTYTVDDAEVELDSVLSELRESPGFKETVNIISNKWDEPSKQALVENPGVIRLINEHVELGIYERINSVVERERMLGKLHGLSDIQAYKQVGDAINAKGGFSDIQGKSQNQNAGNDKGRVSTKKSGAGDTDRRDKKKSASFTKGSGRKAAEKPEFDPLNMSDEDFEKLPPGKYV